jgi:hypothetical protein
MRAAEAAVTFAIAIAVLAAGAYVAGAVIDDSQTERETTNATLDWQVYENRTAEYQAVGVDSTDTYTDPWLNLSDTKQYDYNKTGEDQTYSSRSVLEEGDEPSGRFGNTTIRNNAAGTSSKESNYVVEPGDRLPDGSTAQSYAIVYKGEYEDNGSTTNTTEFEMADWQNSFASSLQQLERHGSFAIAAFGLGLLVLPAAFIILLVKGAIGRPRPRGR